jgi:type IV fimbrial biogenesis protein FimT
MGFLALSQESKMKKVQDSRLEAQGCRPEKLRAQSNFENGFSLLEMLVVIAIAGVLAAVAVPSYMGMIKKHKLTQYGTEMEYLVKYAKIIAMEKTTNTGVCISGGTNLTIYNIGTSRSASICSGTAIKSMTILNSDNTGYNISVSGSASGYAASFDPRGLAIQTGNICVTNGTKYYRAVVSRAGIRAEEGSGGCP